MHAFYRVFGLSPMSVMTINVLYLPRYMLLNFNTSYSENILEYQLFLNNLPRTYVKVNKKINVGLVCVCIFVAFWWDGSMVGSLFFVVYTEGTILIIVCLHPRSTGYVFLQCQYFFSENILEYHL